MFGSGSDNVRVRDGITFGSGTESDLCPGPTCIGIESPLQGEFVRLINLQSVACAKSLRIICLKL